MRISYKRGLEFYHITTENQDLQEQEVISFVEQPIIVFNIFHNLGQVISGKKLC